MAKSARELANSSKKALASPGVASGTDPAYVAGKDGDAVLLGHYTSGSIASAPALDLTASLTLETRFRVNSFTSS